MNADTNNLLLMFAGLCGLYSLSKSENKTNAFLGKIMFFIIAICFLLQAAHMVGWY